MSPSILAAEASPWTPMTQIFCIVSRSIVLPALAHASAAPLGRALVLPHGGDYGDDPYRQRGVEQDKAQVHHEDRRSRLRLDPVERSCAPVLALRQLGRFFG